MDQLKQVRYFCRMHRKVLLSVISILHYLLILAQSETNRYPQGYFRWPLNLRPEIVANLGELRNNHWHMGLDIRTAQKVNQQVYAAASGYISRIRVGPFGFGRAIFIHHPNGFTTLYAHLNDFNPALEKYVDEEQYKRQTWAIDLELTPEQFPVSKGSFIAYSGTTGGSQGPHVHFEIRDTKTEKCLNPLLFGLPIQDNVPPVFIKMSVYDRRISVYGQSPKVYSVRKSGTDYGIPALPVLKTGSSKVSFAIQAYDRISGSANQDGIYSAKLFIDGKAISGFELDNIGYDETEYMNAHIDYKHKYNGGPYFQHLSPLPGDTSSVYKWIDGDGTAILSDTNKHNVRIEITDAYGNSSDLNFLIQWDEALSEIKNLSAAPPHFYPGSVNILEKPDFEVYLPEHCMYDTIPAKYYSIHKPAAGSLSALHVLNDPEIPVHSSFTLRIKSSEPLPGKWYNKVIIRAEYGDKKTFRKAAIHNGFMAADFNNFGKFQAFLDLEPPVINELGRGDTINLSGSPRITFQPRDNFEIKNFRAELDGKWLKFTNDKGRIFIYEFDERCPYGVHELKVVVEDLAGNSTTKTWWFKRYPYQKPPAKKRTSTKKRR